MKNLIYQVWTGELRPACKHSEKLFREYAARIGAEYRLDINPNVASKVCDVPVYFECMNPLIQNEFLEYDKICIVDMDVFPVEGLEENIFDTIGDKDCAICTEPFQGKYRASTTIGGSINLKNDLAWVRQVKNLYNSELPLDENGYPKVYNAGMIVISRQGIKKAREKFVSFQSYIDVMRKSGFGRFYTLDQNYFHAMMCAHLDYIEIDNGWNSYVHFVRGILSIDDPIHDGRPKNKTKFVHIQLSGADFFDNEKIDRITNLPMKDWNL